MDPVLLEILLDGVTKYLSGIRQTKYVVGGNRQQKASYWDCIHKVNGQEIPSEEEDEYWQLQRNQEAIGWDNLLRGKFAKDWSKINRVHNKKLNNIQRDHDRIQQAEQKRREAEEQQQNLYWDPTRPTKKRKMKKNQRSKYARQMYSRECLQESSGLSGNYG